MSFTNTNYEAKLSSTMTENWLVQIFKNNASSVITTATPNTTDNTHANYNLRFSFSETTYNGYDYYPAIINKPTISYSLDLKSFTTKTGAITLNIANIDLDGTTLLELLGSNFINGHVNILSQIDNDNTANNALQIFSGKVSSFGYRNNTIVLSIISNRPFQSVSLPQAKTTGDFSGSTIPYVLGDYGATSASTLSKSVYDLYKVPYIRNDLDNLVFLLPNKITDNTSSIVNMEFYDRNVQRFIPLNKAGFSSTTTAKRLDVSSATGGTTLEVNSQLVKTFNVLPNDIVDESDNEKSAFFTSELSSTAESNLENAFDTASDGSMNDTSFGTLGGTINASAPDDASGAATMFIKFPKPQGKITNFNLRIKYNLTLSGLNQGTYSDSGVKLLLNDATTNNIADEANAIFVFGTAGGSTTTRQKTSIGDTTFLSNIDSTTFNAICENGQVPDTMALTLKFLPEVDQDGDYDTITASLKIYGIFAQYTTALTTTTEPIAKQESNANIEALYLGQDITTSSFNGHSATNDNLNNPVSIHRQIIKDFVGIDSLATDADNVNNGYKAVADIRDSDASQHWKTRLALYKPEELERIMERLQYEGCFFFQYNPQAQQSTTISGVSELRYFTIEDSVNANVDLSQNDISDYELSITPTQDLETNLVVNFKQHPAESKYEHETTFEAGTHTTIFGDSSVQKQEINLNLLYDEDSIKSKVGSRNSSWINFKKSLFGEYKTIVSTTLVNPEKYAMLQVGDYIDFGEILFSELGSPFSEISDTFDSFVAMPTRLFSEAWSGKKFIITNLKRQVGKVSVITREV